LTRIRKKYRPITTFLSLSLHSEIAGRFRAQDLNFWLTSSKRPSLLALLQLYLQKYIMKGILFKVSTGQVIKVLSIFKFQRGRWAKITDFDAEKKLGLKIFMDSDFVQ